jgi:tagaturonate reductase
MVPFSIMYGNETVKESVDGSFSGKFINDGIFTEIVETIDMDKTELQEFSDAVLDRFRNPFIKHLLSSIALNSIDKFKVRVLPSVLKYIETKGKVPTHLTYAFACMIRFYKGSYNEKNTPVNDSADIVAAFAEIFKSDNTQEIIQKTLTNTNFWGQDLNKIDGLANALEIAYNEIEANGIEQGYSNFSKQF